MEMRWMPFVFGLIILMTLRSVVFGKMSNVVDLFVVYCYFGIFSIGSFWYRLYQYGHNLDPHAPMHIKPFTPLLIGVKQIANFRETQFPTGRRVSALRFGVAHCTRRLVFKKGARMKNSGERTLCSVLVKAFCLHELFLEDGNLNRAASVRKKVRFGGTPKPARDTRALPGLSRSRFA